VGNETPFEVVFAFENCSIRKIRCIFSNAMHTHAHSFAKVEMWALFIIRWGQFMACPL
jgi:hypothetical protein